MSLTKIDDGVLLSEERWHVTQQDIPAKSADEMKAFMDYVPREVIIPKVNELVDSVNFVIGASEGGDDYTYSKAQVDAFLTGKADVGDSYTKAQSDELLANSYTKAQTDALIAALPQHADYVIEQGTDGTWWYRKWQSGDVECWGKFTDVFAPTAAVGSTGYYRSELVSTAYPKALFTGIQFVTIQLLNSSAGVDVRERLVKGSPEQIQWYLFSSTASESMTVAYLVNVRGKWK